ncbi:proteoglycan 4-like [Durio zibethinus]|uniref:Proteoglycan 4-like n=1 Tax=Durio zibethinus TaxID=66656 RepID=A0A6P6A4U6_DURZI|nr:proteoglycan 4-like [Durio zibethinus]
MSNQPAPTRPWFRLASIARPAPQAPTPTPEPVPAPPRATTVRPAFRPAVQAQPPPTQPQAPTAAPPLAGGVSSVPTSPVAVGRVSQPTSPSDKRTTRSPGKNGPTTSPLIAAITASVPTSPAKPVATTASVPTSPAKPVATTASVPTSPAKPLATTASVPTSPAKPLATTASVPTSPAKTVPTTTSVTRSPTQKPASSVTTTTREPTPIEATTTFLKPAIQSPIQSPKIKPPTAPPPSPLTLPPPQLKAQAELEPKIPVEAEQKTVLIQKTIDKPKGWLFGASQKDLGDTRRPGIPLNGQKEPSKDGEKKEKDHGKKFSSDSEDGGMRVITIAGENKGAFMELIKSPQKNGFQGSPHRLQKKVNSSKTGSDGSDYQSYSSGEEGDRKMKDKSKSKSNTSKTTPMNAYMNSNVQGVNNSIVYNSSCTHHDPGVHLSLHRKPTGGGFHVKERTNGYNS